jgi:diguanylate cyclase (GGDEF)-like protein
LPEHAPEVPGALLEPLLRILHEADAVDDVLDAIAHAAQLISPHETLTLWENGGSVEASVRQGAPLGRDAAAVDELLRSKVSKTRRALSTLDRFGAPEEQVLADEYSRRGGLCLTRPLNAYGELVGLLTLHYTGRPVLGAAEFDALRKFADSAAVALFNARARQEMRDHAYVDQLTGLANRRRLENEFARLRNTALSLLLIDFDGLKAVNDALGYDRGDALITAIGSGLVAVGREGELTARLGGDEFVVLMPWVDESRARRRAEELTEELDGLSVPDDVHPFFQGASVGCATAGADEDPWAILRRAAGEMRSRKRRRKSDRDSPADYERHDEAFERHDAERR